MFRRKKRSKVSATSLPMPVFELSNSLRSPVGGRPLYWPYGPENRLQTERIATLHSWRLRSAITAKCSQTKPRRPVGIDSYGPAGRSGVSVARATLPRRPAGMRSLLVGSLSLIGIFDRVVEKLLD